MSSLFKGLAEHITTNRPVASPTSNKTNTLYLAQVLDVITGEAIQQYILSGDADADGVTKEDLYKFVGAIFIKIEQVDKNRTEEEVSRIAFPIDRGDIRLPLPGELVLVLKGFSATDNNTTQGYFYSSILTTKTTRNSIEPGALTQRKVVAQEQIGLFQDVESEEILNNSFKNRFFDKTIHTNLAIEPFSATVPAMREGDHLIEGRFGGSIRFTATLKQSGTWPTSEYHKQLFPKTSRDGDPFIVIKVPNKKAVPESGIEVETTTYDKIDDNINDDVSSLYINTSQNVPMIMGASKKMYTWVYDIENELDFPFRKPDLNSTTLQATIPDVYDPSQQLSISSIALPNLEGMAFNAGGQTAEVATFVPATPPNGRYEEALVKSFEAVFAKGESHGMCGFGTYNHADKFVAVLKGQSIAPGFTQNAGGNANGDGFHQKLQRVLGYVKYDLGLMSKATLVNYMKNGPPGSKWGVGDVAVYWALEPGPTDTETSHVKYGHAQFYVGKLTGNGNWTTDNRYNYRGSSFVYGARSSPTWHLLAFKPPQL